MHEKNWAKAVECGRELMKADYGYGLMDSYQSIFTLENEQNKEIIFACTEERGTQLELWHDHCLPGNYPCLSSVGTASRFPGLSIAHLTRTMIVYPYWLANIWVTTAYYSMKNLIL